ncbi:DUF397 domain-containing protein [Streptomyces sp. NEAU-W12]|uniref:DUF397 domain-containing protein n=1 Tax=Streptomyces sp. NEAU-W12 TaxID=2994668 RepID=UPI00224B9899|nr:DUF397 domain-containing protein [Streptomyces sp. NEAU-W12]MCX2923326.1 DUF397 domain-containing protein [Streptomyces sp. NEAU-W12]
MNTEQSARLDRFRSNCSGDEGGECLEVAAGATSLYVRDSKERGGPRLVSARSAWSGFVADPGRDRI